MSTFKSNLTLGQTNTKKHLAFLVNNDIFAETMLVRLQKKGFQVNIHYTIQAFEATAQNNSFYPDALIVDIDHFDLEALSILKAKVDFENITFFLLSSKNDIETRLKAAKAHADAFIPKPFNADHFTDMIANSFDLEKRKIHNVLIVDDDPLTLGLCQKLLEAQNIRTRFIENPIDILDELENHTPDLILLDYYMPYANGLDINRVIRQIYSTSEIPILFMTGSQDAQILSDIRQESCFEPIAKPVIKEDFTARVLQVLQ